MTDIVGKAKGRVVVTTFASNVARLRAAAEAGLANGRQVIVMGRAMERVIAVARECGYLDGLPPFLGPDPFERMPRDKVLALATGSQGEPRAALARIAEDEHPSAARRRRHRDLLLAHHSRQREGGRQDHQRPRRRRASRSSPTAPIWCMSPAIRAAPNLRKMYAWLKPRIAVPAHGEPVHLSEHVAFAKAQGVPEVVRAFNGDVVELAEGEAGVVGQIEHGRRYKDGEILLPAGEDCVGERRKLSFAGVVSIALALSPKGEMIGRPRRHDRGPAAANPRGRGIDALIDSAIFETFESLPRGKRRDADFVSGAIERAVRNAVNAVWGKKPMVHVLVVEV